VASAKAAATLQFDLDEIQRNVHDNLAIRYRAIPLLQVVLRHFMILARDSRMIAITLAEQIDQWLRWHRESREAAREFENHYCLLLLHEPSREEGRNEDRGESPP
jgi:hypothetical protein